MALARSRARWISSLGSDAVPYSPVDMSYRRENEVGVESSRWRLRHAAELVASGVPPGVADDDRRWIYVLLHGDDLATGWSVDWLRDEQARDLLTLLAPCFTSEVGYDLLSRLRARCDPTPPRQSGAGR